MKTAVIFTGFFRTFHYTKQSFKNCIMDPLNVDIFFSAPKTLFTLSQQEDPMWLAQFPHHSANAELVEPEIIDFFGDKLKSYELIDYEAEPYKKLCKEHNIPYITRDGLPSFRILSQLNSKELSMKVFKKYVETHKINYDLVIMLRGDLKYFTSFDFSLINLDKIGYPNHNKNIEPFIPRWCPPSNRIPKALNDQLLVGTQKNMLVWCNVAQAFFEFFKEDLYFTSENIMAYHLMKNNIDWYGSNYIGYQLWRNENGTIGPI